MGNSTRTKLPFIGSGETSAVAPKTKAILAILEPMALPIASPGASSRAAIVETSISGAEVPKATIVRPINRGDMPRWLAVAEAPSTKRSALQISRIKPIKTAAMAISIVTSINRVEVNR